MFGYVLPRRDVLEPAEQERFRSAYCGLCHVLEKRFGWTARFLLNYDFTFLSLLLTQENASFCTQQHRCMASPFRKRCVGLCGAGQEEAADESVILAWWKFRDQVEDDGVLRSLFARVLSWIYRPAYQKAAAFRPRFDHTVRTCLIELRQLEQENCPSLDRTADTFARILSAAAQGQTDETRHRTLELLLYHLGRWIYLADAWDDMEEDRARGNYNPILLRYSIRTEADLEKAREAVRVTMDHSLNLTRSAFYLLNQGMWSPLTENILGQGLPLVEQLVLSGRWKDRRKSLRREKHQ